MRKKDVILEIKKGNTTLANCYFAVEDLAGFEQEARKSFKADSADNVRKAVIFLQKLGAGFEKAEIKFARQMPELKNLNLKRCEDRDFGSIGVSLDVMGDNERWGEEIITFKKIEQ